MAFDNINLDDPKTQFLLATALGLLGGQGGRGGGGFARDLGQAGLLGMNAYTSAARTQEATKRGEMERKLHEGQLADAERARQFRQSIKFTPGGPIPYNDTLGSEPPQGPVGMRPEGLDLSAAEKIDPLAAYQLKQGMKKQNTVLPRGAMLLGPDNMPIQSNVEPPKPEKPPELVRYQAILDDPTTPPSVKATVKAYLEKVTSHGPAANVTTNVLPPREVFKDSLTLKKDFDGTPEVKGFKEVRMAWDQISTALAKPSAANDLAAATKYMKLLDPGSVVRESELAMAMQASGALDRMANYHKRLIRGEKLTPSQREDFFSSGKALYEAAKGRYEDTVKQYEGIAKQYNLDPTFIYRGKEPLSKNTTAIVKARNAIKAGAPRDQVIKRMVEEGYDPEGL